MGQYCSSKSSAKVSYNFANKKDVFTSRNVPIDIAIDRGIGYETNTLYKFGTSITVPANAGTVEVYLCGEAFLNFPICQVGYVENFVGTATSGITLSIESSPNPGQYPQDNCSPNSMQQNIPAINYYNEASEWNGANAVIGLKFSPQASITITDSKGNIFTDSGIPPISFKVACDDECPHGCCKCECTNYPGYCCYDKNGNPL